MAVYVIQTVALLFAAYLAGCVAGCWLRGRLDSRMAPASQGAGSAGAGTPGKGMSAGKRSGKGSGGKRSR